jgi:hypothetical protein
VPSLPGRPPRSCAGAPGEAGGRVRREEAVASGILTIGPLPGYGIRPSRSVTLLTRRWSCSTMAVGRHGGTHPSQHAGRAAPSAGYPAPARLRLSPEPALAGGTRRWQSPSPVPTQPGPGLCVLSGTAHSLAEQEGRPVLAEATAEHLGDKEHGQCQVQRPRVCRKPSQGQPRQAAAH